MHEVLAVGSAYFDSSDLKTAILRDAGLDVPDSPGARILVEQPVEADDGRAITRERVVHVPEERQRIVNVVERGRRLEDVAERNLLGEQPGRLDDERQRVDRLTHRQVPAGEEDHPVP